MNLRDYLPNYFNENEFVSIDLSGIYKTHSAHSHLMALETIFAEGVKYALEVYELHPELTEQFKEDDQLIAVRQALSMGKSFVK